MSPLKQSLKEQEGRVAGPYQAQVTQKQISLFCQAIGAKEGSVAPPTFLTAFRKGEFDLFKDLGFELSQVLHAEQEYEYENPLMAGDQVSFKTTLAHVLEKQSKSSSLQFLSFETQFQSVGADKQLPIGKAKTTVVIRSKRENHADS
jgi:hypothetical protein